MGLFSALFGSSSDEYMQLTASTKSEEELAVDECIDYLEHPDVRHALKSSLTLSLKERQLLRKIDDAYKGVEIETYQESEAREWQEWRDDVEQKKQLRKDRKQIAEAMSEVEESQGGGWFFGLF